MFIYSFIHLLHHQYRLFEESISISGFTCEQMLLWESSVYVTGLNATIIYQILRLTNFSAWISFFSARKHHQKHVLRNWFHHGQVRNTVYLHVNVRSCLFVSNTFFLSNVDSRVCANTIHLKRVVETSLLTGYRNLGSPLHCWHISCLILLAYWPIISSILLVVADN